MSPLPYEPRKTKYLSVHRAAERLGIAHTTLYRWIDQGRCAHAVTTHGVKVIPVPEVERVRVEVEAERDASGDGQLMRGRRVGKRAEQAQSRRRRTSGKV